MPRTRVIPTAAWPHMTSMFSAFAQYLCNFPVGSIVLISWLKIYQLYYNGDSLWYLSLKPSGDKPFINVQNALVKYVTSNNASWLYFLLIFQEHNGGCSSQSPWRRALSGVASLCHWSWRRTVCEYIFGVNLRHCASLKKNIKLKQQLFYFSFS